MLTVKFLLNQLPISLGVDTGTSVTLLSESAYSTLKLKLLDIPLDLQKSSIAPSSVQGSTLHAPVTVIFHFFLHPVLKFLILTFM